MVVCGRSLVAGGGRCVVVHLLRVMSCFRRTSHRELCSVERVCDDCVGSACSGIWR